MGLRRLIACALLAACAAFADEGAPVKYAGGTLADVMAGAAGALRTSDDMFLAFSARKREIHVAYDKVNLIEYGQNVNRRLALAVVISPMFLLSKSRKHFLTIGFQDAQGRQQAMVFQIDKDHVRAMLVSLEARTGLKVQYQDDEARKAGKG